jgi:predicted metal-dependent hydrolase
MVEFGRVKLWLTSISTPVDGGVDSLCITVRPAVDNSRASRLESSEAGATVRPVTPSRTPHTGPAVEVRRSARRRRTVAAYRDGDRIVVLIPARFTRAEEARWVAQMVDRLERTPRRRPKALAGDAGLARRAAELSAAHLDGRAVPAQVRWVASMRTRWASCTPTDRTIRVSQRLREMPAWVLDYVLVHELAHLIEPGHGPAFWALVNRYPRTERARGYLDGVAVAAGLQLAPDVDGLGLNGPDVDGFDVAPDLFGA